MKILSGRTLPQPCVLTVGKFEGIHRGHKALIKKVVKMARTRGVKSAVVAFSPHPNIVLTPNDNKYKPLFTQEERAFLLGNFGVDYLLEYPFDVHTMALSAQEFSAALYRDLQAKIVIAGEDFRFGNNREGTAACLPVAHVIKDYENISTSAIRALLDEETPQLTRAGQMLGFPFFVMGQVKQGRKLGRGLGFPTLNLYPAVEKFLPKFGVYATQTNIGGHVFKGVTNIGLRPTVNAAETIPTIETHLFDFNADAYGRAIRIEFLHFIREERKFPNFDALAVQIKKDAKIAENIAIYE
ncbi:MAG: riboflavin biosynthesis protein RibF [Defluviitaleaceae bacterium]|nr:riboflavin biosynthesis protein RibF [Defluviitaleaceae bacterium]MCL2275956.1 riboflavin biosynthesis protein RibF [Defluviitaleaceae bacterium]